MQLTNQLVKGLQIYIKKVKLLNQNKPTANVLINQ